MPHYFDEEQDSEMRTVEITAVLRENQIKLITASGTFSPSKVDIGTRILIDNCIIGKKDARILDLGCGYGPVGIALAKAFPEAEIVMTDINKRATALARKNAKLNKVRNVKVLQGDMYEKVAGKFDAILLNPPQHAGKEVCVDMISRSREFLKKDGTLQIVARHNKGGKGLSQSMKDTFGNEKTIAKKGMFRVYMSVNL